MASGMAGEETSKRHKKLLRVVDSLIPLKMVFRNFSKIVSCQEILKGESQLLKLVTYNIIYEMNRQSRIDAGFRMLGAGVLG